MNNNIVVVGFELFYIQHSFALVLCTINCTFKSSVRIVMMQVFKDGKHFNLSFYNKSKVEK